MTEANLKKLQQRLRQKILKEAWKWKRLNKTSYHDVEDFVQEFLIALWNLPDGLTEDFYFEVGNVSARSQLQQDQFMVGYKREVVHEIPRDDLAIADEAGCTLWELDCVAHSVDKSGNPILTENEMRIYDFKRQNHERTNRGRLGRREQLTGYTDQEIADILGITQQAVNDMWQTVKAKLRNGIRRSET